MAQFLQRLVCVVLIAGGVSCSSSEERRLKWNLRTTVRQYEKTDRRDPKWDAAAIEGLTLYSRWRSDPPHQSNDLAQQIARRSQEAVTAGCPDPLVLYVHARFVLNQPARSQTEIAATHRQIAAGLKASRYSSLPKFYGFLRAGEHLYQLQPVPKLEVTEMMNDAAAQLAIALEEDDAPYSELYQAARAFMEPFHQMQIGRNWGWAKLQPLLQKKWGLKYASDLSLGETRVD